MSRATTHIWVIALVAGLWGCSRDYSVRQQYVRTGECCRLIATVIAFDNTPPDWAQIVFRISSDDPKPVTWHPRLRLKVNAPTAYRGEEFEIVVTGTPAAGFASGDVIEYDVSLLRDELLETDWDECGCFPSADGKAPRLTPYYFCGCRHLDVYLSDTTLRNVVPADAIRIVP